MVFQADLGKGLGTHLVKKKMQIRNSFLKVENLWAFMVLFLWSNVHHCCRLWSCLLIRKGSMVLRLDNIQSGKKKFKKEVHLSSHVHHLPLVNLLEFVYLGYLQSGEDLVKTLKSFVEDCKLQPLLQMLHRNRPKWGMPFPGLYLALALNFDAHVFSYVFLLD